jgi:uncharacterized phage protein (TIGR02218 family)
VLGDSACRFDLTASGFATERPVQAVVNGQSFGFSRMNGFAPRWFERGRLVMLSGAAEGLSGVIKHDQFDADGGRRFELWEPLRAKVEPGDRLRLEAGCDKRHHTCKFKFNNYRNFRGFPFIPGEDWLISVPTGQGDDTGGSLSS